MLNVKLRYLDDWNQMRRDVARRYEIGFRHLPQIICPILTDGGIVHQYTVRVPRRDELKSFLHDRRIGARVYYDRTLPDYLGMAKDAQECPLARSATQEVISIPVHPLLTSEEQQYVIDSMLTFYDSHSAA